jgi:hypothetical protein
MRDAITHTRRESNPPRHHHARRVARSHFTLYPDLLLLLCCFTALRHNSTFRDLARAGRSHWKTDCAACSAQENDITVFQWDFSSFQNVRISLHVALAFSGPVFLLPFTVTLLARSLAPQYLRDGAKDRSLPSRSGIIHNYLRIAGDVCRKMQRSILYAASAPYSCSQLTWPFVATNTARPRTEKGKRRWLQGFK